VVRKSFSFFLLLACAGYGRAVSAQISTAPAKSVSQAQAQAVPDELATAEALIVKSDWKGAEGKLDVWIAAHPTDARALFDAGYVADAMNRLGDAEGLYRRAVDANPKSFEARLSLGLLLARQNKIEDAHPELEAATALDPADAGEAMKARAWRALAKIDSEDDATRASNDLLEALKISPETTEDTLLAAKIAENSREYAAAETAYRRVLAKDAGSAEASAGLAHVLIAEKKYPEAEALLRTALEKMPDDAPLTAQLAAVLVAQDKGEALPVVEKLHEAHPDDAAITRMLAQILAEAGDYAGSDHLYLGLLKASPKDPALLIAHGQNLIRQLQFAPAYAVFDKATQADPSDADGWSGLAFAASRTNRPDITLHALTERSKFLPEVPSTYFLWATAYDSLHQRVQAAAYYHHFLDASAGKFPDQEWQARQRLNLLEKKP
jgi:tetratricopeptide (TPR) repeat protein